MTTAAEILQALQQKALDFGGTLKVLTVEQFELLEDHDDAVSSAPFNTHLACNWDLKEVYIQDSAVTCLRTLAEVIHEMGHVFACTEAPLKSEEVEFIGWEYSVALELGLDDQWLQSMASYGIGGYIQKILGPSKTPRGEFGDLTLDEQMELLEEMCFRAERDGLLQRGIPVAIR